MCAGAAAGVLHCPHPPGLRVRAKRLQSAVMKFALAILVFLLFTCFIGWGIVLLMHGSPWMLLASLGVFFGTFIKYGCLSQ